MIDQEKALEIRKRLDELTDQINQRIISYENKFQLIGFGLQCMIKTSDFLKIGYIRQKGQWKLVIKEVDSELIWPLIESPRAYRLHALNHMSELEDALILTAEKAIKKMEKYLYNGADKDDHLDGSEDGQAEH